jgi:hypothetical protein
MKNMLSVILACCLISSCAGGEGQEPPLKEEIVNPIRPVYITAKPQEPPLKEEIVNPEAPAATSMPEPPAEVPQKADAPFLSLNKTGTVVLGIIQTAEILIIGYLTRELRKSKATFYNALLQNPLVRLLRWIL